MGSEKREHITQIIENILDYRSEKKKITGRSYNQENANFKIHLMWLLASQRH